MNVENKYVESKQERVEDEGDDEVFSRLLTGNRVDYQEVGRRLKEAECEGEKFLALGRAEDAELVEQLSESMRRMHFSHRLVKDHLYAACLGREKVGLGRGFWELAREIEEQKRNAAREQWAAAEELVRLVSVGIAVEGSGLVGLLGK